jgi:hypothetical protein
MKLLESTTFQMCVVVLTIGALAAGFTSDVTWLEWLDKALEAVFVYAAKESVKYGASAYGGKSDG